MKFRKRPVEIEAFQMTKEAIKTRDWPEWLTQAWKDKVLYFSYDQFKLKIKTLEGNMSIAADDYVIQGVRGEIYPCKPDIFHLTYEEVKD